jgi:hypothetical protein
MNDIIISLLKEKIDYYSHNAKLLYDDYKYYCYVKALRQELYSTLKIRNEFKRALKEYKKLLHNVQIEKYKKAIKEYREHPDKYAEDILGVKLYPYQKEILKYFYKAR